MEKVSCCTAFRNGRLRQQPGRQHDRLPIGMNDIGGDEVAVEGLIPFRKRQPMPIEIKHKAWPVFCSARRETVSNHELRQLDPRETSGSNSSDDYVIDAAHFFVTHGEEITGPAALQP